MNPAESLLKRIVTEHASALPVGVVRDALEILRNVNQRDPWSQFLRLPESGNRAALGKLAKEHGGPAVTRAIEKMLIRPPRVAALAKLKVMLRGGDGTEQIDSVGNCLPPAI